MDYAYSLEVKERMPCLREGIKGQAKAIAGLVSVVIASKRYLGFRKESLRKVTTIMIGKQEVTETSQNSLKNVMIHEKSDEVASVTERLRSLDIVDDLGTTPLHSAVKWGNNDLVKFAIDSGFDINVKDRLGTTPLLTSILYNRFDITKLLLDANAEIDAINLNGKSALQVVLNVKRKVPIEIVRYFYDSLKKKGVSSDEIARKFLTAGSSLVSAIYMNDSQMTRAILESKESIDERESRQSVRVAMRDSTLDNVRVLLQHGPEVAERKLAFNDELYRSIKHVLPDIDFAKPIIERLIDWNLIDAAYVKFLEDVFRGARNEAIKIFLDNKIDVHVKKNYGIDLFVNLCGNANSGIVKTLQSRKIDVTARNSDGKSVLHLAVSNYAIENIRYLLAEGADPNAKDTNGVTPLHESCESMCIELLLRGGADVQATDSYGRTVIQRPSYAKVMDILLAHLAIVEGVGTQIKKEIRYAIQSRDRLKATYDSLCDQIVEMKKRKIFRSYSLFTILSQKPENIVHSVRSPSVLFMNLYCNKNRQWHRYYASTMRKHLNRALEIIDLRNKATETVQKCVSHLVHLNCDHLALEMIVGFLSYKDLCAFE